MKKVITTIIVAALVNLIYINWAHMAEAEEQKELFFKLAEQQEDKYFERHVPLIDPEEKAIECLALNIYHEARNESSVGQLAVAWVVINRVKSELFPDSVCGVVYDGRISKWHKENTGKIVPLRNKCQFSWYCDGKSDKVYNPAKFEEARHIAFNVLWKGTKVVDPTQGALWYHADYVNPRWSKDYERTIKIGTHIFYKEK